MITNKIKGDIFKSAHKHIVFAVNIQGVNDAGFAGLVARRHWPELAMIGPSEMGTVHRHDSKDKSFHAVVCHSLGDEGWRGAPKHIEQALNQIPAKDGEEIGVVMMGAGPVGQAQGADVDANLAAMEKSKNKVVVYSL